MTNDKILSWGEKYYKPWDQFIKLAAYSVFCFALGFTADRTISKFWTPPDQPLLNDTQYRTRTSCLDETEITAIQTKLDLMLAPAIQSWTEINNEIKNSNLLPSELASKKEHEKILNERIIKMQSSQKAMIEKMILSSCTT